MEISRKTFAPYRTCVVEDLLACFSLLKGNYHKYAGANHILFSGRRLWMPYRCLLVHLLLAVLARVNPPPPCPFLHLILWLVPRPNALQCPPLASITVGRNIRGPVWNKASSVCPAVSFCRDNAAGSPRREGCWAQSPWQPKKEMWGPRRPSDLSSRCSCVPFLRRG